MNDNILAWAEDDRPREKFILKGRRSLSDAELLAILLGSGTASKSAVSLGRDILDSVGNDLASLARLTHEDLCKINGVGPAKSISILASFELGRRRTQQEAGPRIKIKCSADVYAIFRDELRDLHYEEFWILLLNKAHVVMHKIMISQGGISGTIADPKMIFESALSKKASGLVLVHNHPSGNLNPSNSDVELTKKMRKAGEFLDLPILDHIIVANDGYYSFADEGNF